MARAIESTLFVPALQKLCDLTRSVLSRGLCPGTCNIYKRTNNRLFVKTHSPPGSGTVKVTQQMGYEISFTAIKCYTSSQSIPVVYCSLKMLDH